MTRCYSSCRKVERSKCNLPRCVMTNGKTRQYCTLSNKYYLVKSGNQCITKKRLTLEDSKKKIGKLLLNKQKNKKADTLKNKQELTNQLKEAYTVRALNRLKKNIMGRRIKKIVLATPAQRRTYFLKSVCSDSNACLSFGTQIKKINDLFNGFVRFDYVDPPITRIGKISNNGFVNEIKYSRYGYNAYAVLKSSIHENADNLMYEYIVGQFINKTNKLFSCFLETYGLFTYVSDAHWEHVKNTKTISTNVLTDSLTPINIDPMNALSLACLNSKHLSILIQYVNKPITLADQMSVNYATFVPFVKNQLIYVLYQIYLPLALLCNVFTHYDLHSNNVLLYKPADNKYIEYHYHLSNKVITFKSLYIAKIIDYGRCFFKDIEGNLQSRDVYNRLCSLAVCGPDCGSTTGFGWLPREDYPGRSHYISSQQVNRSHDLRLLVDMYTAQAPRINQADPYLARVLSCVNYQTTYGTKERTERGIPINKLNNVKDVEEQLRIMVQEPSRTAEHDAFYADPQYSKYGDIHIYADGRPMEYIS